MMRGDDAADKISTWLAPVTLTGSHVVLVPLGREHESALADATRDGQLWELWYTTVPKPLGMLAEIERRLDLAARGAWLPFAVIDPRTETAVGLTSYINVDGPNRHLEIGSTWYAKSVQRTALNTEAKLLLLAYAFDELNCIAVEFRTSYYNRQSQAAIERLGAKLDGTLRSNSLHRDGTLRDTCVYSIIACEWPAVRSGLLHRLSHQPHSQT